MWLVFVYLAWKWHISLMLSTHPLGWGSVTWSPLTISGSRKCGSCDQQFAATVNHNMVGCVLWYWFDAPVTGRPSERRKSWGINQLCANVGLQGWGGWRRWGVTPGRYKYRTVLEKGWGVRIPVISVVPMPCLLAGGVQGIEGHTPVSSPWLPSWQACTLWTVQTSMVYFGSWLHSHFCAGLFVELVPISSFPLG